MSKIICSSSFNVLNSNFTEVPTCGDVNIDLIKNQITPLSEVTNVDEFNKIIFNEFVDAKNRQTITSYPLLRLLYERYLTSDNCTNLSNGYVYSDMDKMVDLIGNYWIDLVEQFIPSTTIWGSTLVYRNTIFDSQKYKYKSNSLFVCEDPSKDFPFSAISSDCGVEVIKVKLNSDAVSTSGATPFDSSNFFSCENYTYCDCVWTMTNYCSSEFLGNVIGDNEFKQYCEDTLYIEPVQLYMSISNAPICNGLYQTWDGATRVFRQVLKITDSSFIPINTDYTYEVETFGPNPYNITMTVNVINVSTIEIVWSIPPAAPNPVQQLNCPGYYLNETITNAQYPPIINRIWNVEPIVTVTDPIFNCEIARLFIYKGSSTGADNPTPGDIVIDE